MTDHKYIKKYLLWAKVGLFILIGVPCIIGLRAFEWKSTKDRTVSTWLKNFTVMAKNMPTVQDVRALAKNDTHSTSETIAIGGRDIGRIYKAATEMSVVTPEVPKAFIGCASDQNIPTSLRAVCAKKALQLIPRLDARDVEETFQIYKSRISSEVQSLAERI